MKRRLVPTVLVTALTVGVFGCNTQVGTNQPPFPRLVQPGVTVKATVTDPTQPVRLVAPGGTLLGTKAFDITLPAGALTGLIQKFGPVEVAVKIPAFTDLSAAEQSLINTTTSLALLQMDFTPLQSGGALFTAGLRTKQNVQTNLRTFTKVKNQSGRRCTPGQVDFFQIFGTTSTRQASAIFIDDEFPIQNIVGDADVAYAVLHFIFCFECPRVTPTASPTATPTPSPSPSPTPRPSASSGISGASSTTGGSPSGGVAPAGT